MIRMQLVDLPHECAAGAPPCLCPLHALVTEAGDVVPCRQPERWEEQGGPHRAVERAARAARQRRGNFELVDEMLREDLVLPPCWSDPPF